MTDVTYRNFTLTDLPTKPLFDTIKQSLKKSGITDNVEIELQIVGRWRIKRLNREFRGKDYATDVLSFPIWPDLATIKQHRTNGKLLLGSVVVCLPVAIKEAKADQCSILDKITFLIDHSVLHLLGFHHEGD